MCFTKRECWDVEVREYISQQILYTQFWKSIPDCLMIRLTNLKTDPIQTYP